MSSHFWIRNARHFAHLSRGAAGLLGRGLLGVACLTGSMSGVLSDSLNAADILQLEATRHGALLKKAFQEVVPPVAHYAVRVEVNNQGSATGTLVDSAKGWVVAKASELNEVLSQSDSFTCQGVGFEATPARFVGYEKDLDLVLLKLPAAVAATLPPVVIASEYTIGQWVISVGCEQKLPLGVGVLGAAPREIETGQGFIGLSVEETEKGLVVTQVQANSTSAAAGLKKGDVLLKEDQRPAGKRAWLSKKLGEYEPGDWMPLPVERNGEILELDLRLGVSWDNIIERQAIMNRFGSDVSLRRTGLRSVFQHDTLMHPRDCGGPLVNLDGGLVGVNIARAGRTDTYAVPIAEVLELFRKQAPR